MAPRRTTTVPQDLQDRINNIRELAENANTEQGREFWTNHLTKMLEQENGSRTSKRRPAKAAKAPAPVPEPRKMNLTVPRNHRGTPTARKAEAATLVPAQPVRFRSVYKLNEMVSLAQRQVPVIVDDGEVEGVWYGVLRINQTGNEYVVIQVDAEGKLLQGRPPTGELLDENGEPRIIVEVPVKPKVAKSQ